MLMFLAGAHRTYPLDHVVDRVHAEALGKLDLRNVHVPETIRPVAGFAIEMDMHVFDRAFLLAGTYLVLRHAASVLEFMDHMPVREHGQDPEDARPVHAVEHDLQFGKRKRTPRTEHRPEHKHPVGRGLHAFLLQYFRFKSHKSSKTTNFPQFPQEFPNKA